MFYDELNGPSQKCCVSANPLGHPYTVGVSGLSKDIRKDNHCEQYDIRSIYESVRLKLTCFGFGLGKRESA